jgi:hypothetical protein
VIVMPVYEDFAAARLVCEALDRALEPRPEVEARVLLLDDGSPTGIRDWSPFSPRALRRIDVVRLRRNLGHQRAIAVGLCHLDAGGRFDAVLVMDSDGEDRPDHVPLLLAELARTPQAMIFAERRKRMEGGVFRLGYLAYRVLHRVLTGIPVRVGNFSLLPAAAVTRLVSMAELWNHYAGAAARSRFPLQRLPLDRGSRVLGQSKMGGVVPLVTHGIAGIATFHDVVATRLLIASSGAAVALAAAMLTVLVIRFETSLAIPGWATYTTGLLLLLSIQVASIAFSLVLSLVSTRFGATFVPCRDYAVFVERVEGLTAIEGPPTAAAPRNK